MAVKDPRNFETRTPMPEGDMKQNPPAKSMVDRLKAIQLEGLEVQTFREAAGMNKPDPTDSTKDATNMMMQMFTASQNAFVQTLSKLVELQSAGGGEKHESEFMKFLMTEYTARQKMLEEGMKVNPMQTMTDFMEWQNKMQEQVKKQIGAASATQASDMPLMIELEKIRQEGQDRQRKFDLELAAMKQQWTREDVRWEKEFGLKVAESRSSAEQKQETLNVLKDTAASVIESIESGQGVAGNPPPPAGQPASQPAIPTSFTCPNPECGTTIASGGLMEGKCAKCGTEWFMKAQQ